jgi:hypothetical protein
MNSQSQPLCTQAPSAGPTEPRALTKRERERERDTVTVTVTVYLF